MTDWKNTQLPTSATIRDAVESLNRSTLQVVLICTDDDKLEGVVTDGDIRRGLLTGQTLDHPVTAIMNTSFSFGLESDDDASLLRVMRQKEFRQLPILSAEGRILGLKTLMQLVNPPSHDNWVVLMAGGLGTRLRPLTKECPKPLLPVGGKPVLETIVKQFLDHGFNKFFISLNYKADMIRAHFGDGSKLGAEIRYLEEQEQLGTAGALGLLPEGNDLPVFVMNGDLLTRVDFPKMLALHETQKAEATMAVRSFEMQVPYGVVNVEDNQIVSIQEKPLHRFFINAGIYVLSPQVITEIADNQYLDMPSLFLRLKEQGRRTGAFPIHEYWMDIGQKQDFEQANCEFLSHFSQGEG